MITTHILGHPRIGKNRELKFALESYWKNQTSKSELLTLAQNLKIENWQRQSDLDYVSVGDFSLYDHVADHIQLLGCVPARFQEQKLETLDEYFLMARGLSSSDEATCHHHDTLALDMTKWFDTNYHYLVPEFDENTQFSLNPTQLLTDILAAQTLGYKVKPVILGPLTFLWLGKLKTQTLSKLDLLPQLLPVYQALLESMKGQGIEWVQVDEPILGLNLDSAWLNAFQNSYEALTKNAPNILLTTYFTHITHTIEAIKDLPVSGLHIDLSRAPEQLTSITQHWPKNKVLSLGLIDGRNVWTNNFDTSLELIKKAKQHDTIWIGSSCSLLHTPYSFDNEAEIPTFIRSWLAGAKEKITELCSLKRILDNPNINTENTLELNRNTIKERQSYYLNEQQTNSVDIHALLDQRHSPFIERQRTQHEHLKLPLLPTTTIGSFPQTPELRLTRQQYRQRKITQEAYEQTIRKEIRATIKHQEELGLDVLVHGEAERTDMVEYFGELLDGFICTQYAWVQSYGSRCVKPPIIYANVKRPEAMTVKWTRYAQSLTPHPVKGMLTGPITILQWSFVRDDQARSVTAKQIALAIREEVQDLENAGISIIQIDEPAIREGMPLNATEHQNYLDWATQAFRIASSGVNDRTQIHTHMCYSEFNDILPAIVSMDADVITIETSRSDMELLHAFKEFHYPNEIGPGVFDIHSPQIPTRNQVRHLLQKALSVIEPNKLWVNPDCGLKTRQWTEVIPALKTMIQTTKELRTELTEGKL